MLSQTLTAILPASRPGWWLNPLVITILSLASTLSLQASPALSAINDNGWNSQVSAAILAQTVQNRTLIINELDYDQPGPDTAEFIELKNISDITIDLDPYSVRLVNGDSGGAVVYSTINLPSFSLAPGQYYVICGNAANVLNCDLDVSPNSGLIQNGAPDAVAVVLAGEIIDTVSYEGNTSTPYTEGSGMGLEDVENALGAGISRFPDGGDTDQNNVDWSLRCITPGQSNIQNSGSCVTLALEKAAHPAIYDEVGEVINYTYTLTNTGVVTFTSLFTITDDNASDELCPQPATLAPEATLICTASYTITQADLDAGHVTNLATGQASFGGNPVNSNQDQATVNASQYPAIDIDKTPDIQQIAPGETVTFTIKVSNTGNVTLSSVTVTDQNTPDCQASYPSLAPGATLQYICTLANAVADFTNSATVAGTPPTGPAVSDTDTAEVDVLPTISMTKTADPTMLPEPGGVFTFTLTFTNTSVENIEIVTVTDTHSGAAVDFSYCEALVGDTLVPNQVVACVYTISHTDAGSYANNASITVKDDEGNEATAGDEALVTIERNPGSITLFKAAVPNSPQLFDFTLTGQPNFSLADNGVSHFQTFTDLDKGVYTATEVNLPAGWMLLGLVCNDADGGTVVSGDSITIDLDPGQHITCIFTNTAKLVINEVDYDQPGVDDAEFIEIKNVGTADIDNLSDYEIRLVNDDGTPYSTFNLPDDPLPAGSYYVICKNVSTVTNCNHQRLSLSIQNGSPDAIAIALNNFIVDSLSYEGDVPGYTETTGHPTGDNGSTAGISLSRYPDMQDTDHNSDDFSPRCLTPGLANLSESLDCYPEGQLTIVKEGPASAAHGDTVTYAYKVSYNSPDNSPAQHVVVGDDNCAPVTRISGDDGDNWLEVGESWLYECHYTVPAHSAEEEDPILNVASVSGADLDGHPVTGADSNQVSVELLHAEITGTKFHDLNANGVWDGGESGLENWPIILSGPVNTGTTTDSNGGYAFTNLPPGNYLICEDPTGQTQDQQSLPASGPDCGNGTKGYTVTINGDQLVANRDFGNFQFGAIAGHKFSGDGPGSRSCPDDPGCAGVTIRLDGTTGMGHELHLTTATGSDGSYQFANLKPGTYTVTVEEPTGYECISPVPCNYVITLESGQVVEDVDFVDRRQTAANTRQKGSLEIVKFNDTVVDMQYNGHEVGLAGWTFSVTNSTTSQSAASRVTGSDGKLAIAELDPGNYEVCEIAQAGWFPSTQAGLCQTVTVTAAQTTSVAFGNFNAGIDLEKSTNGHDADSIPGPNIPEGDPVEWSYQLENIGSVPLTNLVVFDEALNQQICTIAHLDPGERKRCAAQGSAVLGQHENKATVTASAPNGNQVGDEDLSHYFGINPLNWSFTCDTHRMEIVGVGMGNQFNTINPQSLTLADPGSVNWMLAQLSGVPDLPASNVPSSVVFSSNAPQSVTLNSPSSFISSFGYTFETLLQPAEVISAWVDGTGSPSFQTPRALVLYSNRTVDLNLWTSLGKTMNEFVWSKANAEHTELVSLPPLPITTDLTVTAVVIDNNNDTRPMVVEANAAGISSQATALGSGPEGDLLNIVVLTLPEVPAGTAEVTITVRSPRASNGDSLAWVGFNVSYVCNIDLDVDTIPNNREGGADADGDNQANYLDSESDGDGILDTIEWNSDANGDKVVDASDRDADGDGWPNFLDLDSDNDGLLDQQEGLNDKNNNSILDFLEVEPASESPSTLYLPLIIKE